MARDDCGAASGRVLLQILRGVSAAPAFVFEIAYRLRALLAVATIVVARVIVWGAYASGGSRTVVPHLFYFTIILGSIRFGWPGAIASASTAGLLAGPALPADVAEHTAQPA